MRDRIKKFIGKHPPLPQALGPAGAEALAKVAGVLGLI